MDRRIYSLMNRILNESVFDLLDDDEDYEGFSDDEKLLAQQAASNRELMKLSLIGCRTKEDVITYIRQETEIPNLIKAMVAEIKNICYGRNYIVSTTEIAGIIANLYENRFKDITVTRGYSGNINIDIIFRDLEYHMQLDLINHQNNYTNSNKRVDIPGEDITCTLCTLTDHRPNAMGLDFVTGYTKTNGSKARSATVVEKIKDFADNMVTDVKVDKFIDELISNYFHAQRIADELTHEPKPVEITPKDISRMKNIINQGTSMQYQGFDAITDPKKMVARIATLFIIAYKHHITRINIADLNETDLLKIFTDAKVYGKNGRYYHTKEANRIIYSITSPKLKAPVHLADVLATYKKYKDDPNPTTKKGEPLIF